MARLALPRKSLCRVVRRALILRLMARITAGIGQLIVAVCVTRSAGCCGMSACQRKRRRVVVERRGFPCARCVAVVACLRERQLRMIRVRRLLKGRTVTRITSGICQLIIAVCVARCAGGSRVFAG